MKYSSLDHFKDEIRLITILQSHRDGSLSSANSTSDLIECRLEHFSLQRSGPEKLHVRNSSRDQLIHLDWDHEISSVDEEPLQWRYSWGDYIALSYEWEDPKNTRPIIVNGKTIHVGSNLEDALRILRGKRPVQAGCKAWVDRLSINQQDLRERSRELTRMHHIYKDACAVVVWLGSAADESHKAMNLIRTLSHSCKMGEDRELGQSLRHQPDLLSKGSWRALSQLFDRSYWSRLWIMQEIALGAGITSVLCGHDAVTWEQLFTATYTFGLHNVDIMFSLIDKERKEIGLPPSGLNRNKIIYLNDEQSVQAGDRDGQFICMLDLSRKSFATDPKDKIYGLLGLMESSLSTRIKPDYEASLTKIYTDFAKAVIIADESLELLEQCTWPKTAMPSWVPDWTNMNHYRLFSGNSTYRATASMKPEIEFIDDDQKFSTHGYLLDMIDGLGTSYSEDSMEAKNETDFLVQPEGFKNAYGSELELRVALWRTLVGNRTPRGQHVQDTYSLLLQCVPETESPNLDAGTSSRGFRAFSHFINGSKDLRIAGTRLRDFFPQDRAPSDNPDAVRDPMERMFRYLRTRRFIVTQEGFLGLAPTDSKRHDFIYLIPRCNVPIVLPPSSDHCLQIVGGCYLHGYMKGEAIECLQYGSLQTETITIRQTNLWVNDRRHMKTYATWISLLLMLVSLFRYSTKRYTNLPI